MIVVTGGTGLVGSHLLFQLVQKNEYVRAIKRPSSNIHNVRKIFGYYSDSSDELFSRIHWVDADLTDTNSLHEALKNSRFVYHCAGLVSFDRRLKKELFEINTEGTGNVVNASLECGVNKICYVSSIASLGEAEEGDLITEKAKWKPEKRGSVYSLSKFKAENEIWRGVAEGLQAVIVNPAVVIGPGFWKNGVGVAISMIKSGMNYYTDGVTGYIDVRDVASIMVQLMEMNISNEKYILSTENLSFKDMQESLSYFLKCSGPAKYLSKRLINIAWRYDWLKSVLFGRSPVLTRDSVRISHKKSYYSNAKIIEKLGYQFVPIKESLQFIVEKYLESAQEELHWR